MTYRKLTIRTLLLLYMIITSDISAMDNESIAMKESTCIEYEEPTVSKVSLAINKETNQCIIHTTQLTLYETTGKKIKNVKECPIQFIYTNQTHARTSIVERTLGEYPLVKKYIHWRENVKVLHKHNNTIIVISQIESPPQTFIRFITEK